MELLKEPLRLKDRLVKVEASMGVAVFPDDAEDLEQLFIKADLRMYDYKRNAAPPVVILEPERPARAAQSTTQTRNVPVS